MNKGVEAAFKKEFGHGRVNQEVRGINVGCRQDKFSHGFGRKGH